MNFNPHGINKGKVVYWIDGVSFENTKDKRDGKQKAIDYCLDNGLNPNDICKFDSRTERDYWEYLVERQNAGEITHLGHHFTLKVQDEFVNANGDLIPPITYEADFVYRDVATNRRVVVDVKGSEYFLDERFITLKQVFDKIMLPKGLYIKVVLYRKGQWIEWHIGEAKKQSTLINKQREELRQLKKEKHDSEVKANKDNRDKARYIELTGMVTSGVKLTSAQKKRLKELDEKFGGIVTWQ